MDNVALAEDALFELCPRRLAGLLTILVEDCPFCRRVREILKTLRDDRSLFQIAIERTFDRILALPEEKRKEALGVLSDCCLKDPAGLAREEAARTLSRLIGPI